MSSLSDPCPNDPRCPHGAMVHDIDSYDDPRPICCASGCLCGTTPAGVWDARTDDFHHERTHERFAWAQKHFPDAAKQVYRAEFWLADPPFAMVYQYATDDHGHRYYDPELDDCATLPPVRVELTELPPPELRAPLAS